MSLMDKDSTKLERTLMFFYAATTLWCAWSGATVLAVFSAFCLGFSGAIYTVIKGWTRYYSPPLIMGGAGMSRAATRSPDYPVAGAVKSASPTQPICRSSLGDVRQPE